MARSSNAIVAKYTSPSETKDFTCPISAKCSTKPTVAERTANLNELRSNTKKLQNDINTFLTEKMAEDKASDTNGKKAKDEVDEDNYGEEGAEDD
jgi:hypothetical protein